MEILKKCIDWIELKEKARKRKTLIKIIGLALLSTGSFSLNSLIKAGVFSGTLSELEKGLISEISKHTPTFLVSAMSSDPMLLVASILFVVCLVVVSCVAFSIFIDSIRNTRPSQLPLSQACRPGPLAREAMERDGFSMGDHVVCGEIVEIARTARLYSDLSISGWRCLREDGSTEVYIRNRQATKFNHRQISNNRQAEVQEQNNTKYSLIETPVNFLDSDGSLILSVQPTDYNSTSAVQREIRKNPRFITENGTLLPEKQRHASSLCLHTLIQLSDGQLLCVLRSSSTGYASNSMSVTCEEQLSLEDMRHGPWEVMGSWFQRMLCEEIFPLGSLDQKIVSKNWEKIKSVVNCFNVISVFYEANYLNYSLFGYCSLSLTEQGFRHFYRSLIGGNSRRDMEGLICILTETQALNFALNGVAKARDIFGGKEIIFGDDQEVLAHPSTLYRLVIFLTASGALPGRPDEISDRRLSCEDHIEKLRLQVQRLAEAHNK